MGGRHREWFRVRHWSDERNPVDGVRGLFHERGRLCTPWLLGHRRVDQQLRQPAGSTEPDLQRVGGVGPRVFDGRQAIGGPLVAEIEHDLTVGTAAGPAMMRLAELFARRTVAAKTAGCRCGQQRWRTACSFPRPSRSQGILHPHVHAAVTTAHGVDPASFVQDSQSRSNLRALRGLHTQAGRGEAKLVRCARGAIHDVVADARPGSPTFARHEPVQLDDEQFWHVFIPSGLLHGFQALSDVADVCYRIDGKHDPRENRAVRYDDPDLAISWPLPVAEMSPRDRRRVLVRAGQRDEQLTLAVEIPVGAAVTRRRAGGPPAA